MQNLSLLFALVISMGLVSPRADAQESPRQTEDKKAEKKNDEAVMIMSGEEFARLLRELTEASERLKAVSLQECTSGSDAECTSPKFGKVDWTKPSRGVLPPLALQNEPKLMAGWDKHGAIAGASWTTAGVVPGLMSDFGIPTFALGGSYVSSIGRGEEVHRSSASGAALMMSPIGVLYGIEADFNSNEVLGVQADVTVMPKFYAPLEFYHRKYDNETEDKVTCLLGFGAGYDNQRLDGGGQGWSSAPVLEGSIYCKAESASGLFASVTGSIRHDIGGRGGDEDVGKGRFSCNVEAGWCFDPRHGGKLSGSVTYTGLFDDYNLPANKDDHDTFYLLSVGWTF